MIKNCIIYSVFALNSPKPNYLQFMVALSLALILYSTVLIYCCVKKKYAPLNLFHMTALISTIFFILRCWNRYAIFGRELSPVLVDLTECYFYIPRLVFGIDSMFMVLEALFEYFYITTLKYTIVATMIYFIFVWTIVIIKKYVMNNKFRSEKDNS